MTFRLVSFLAALALIGCDSSADNGCLSVTPGDNYLLSGTAGTMTFSPTTKAYRVRNTCSSDIELSVEEDARWLDVEIDAFEPLEEGTLGAGSEIEVDIEVRYGSDNTERLNQLAPGVYEERLLFVDESNDTRVERNVQVTVASP